MIVNFGYVVDNEIAGLAHPDTFGDVMSALEDLHSRGIKTLVSLDEIGISPALARENGIDYLHIPIPDFHAPQLDQARQFVTYVGERRAAGDQVAVHCRGGYGRTGTLIACYLISQGKTAEEAINIVRRKRPGSIETAGQEHFLRDFEKQFNR